MNSLDRAWRNERDILILLEIADEATAAYLSGDASWPDPNVLRARYEALVARRAAEDRGETKV